MKRFTLVGGVVGISALMVGCNGDSSDAMNSPPAQGDTFVNAALALAATAPDDIEPADIAAIVETMPEDKEPDPIT